MFWKWKGCVVAEPEATVFVSSKTSPPAAPNSSPVPPVFTLTAWPPEPKVLMLNNPILSTKVSSKSILSFAFVLELSVPSNTKKSPLFAPAPSVPSSII